MKYSFFLCSILIGVSSLCQAQTWNIDYGTEKGQVAYHNRWNSTSKVEDAPFGPMSFRVLNNKLWVLDSLAGKVCCFDEKGKIIKEYVIPGLKGVKLLEDFALTGKDPVNPDSVWVANASDHMLRKVSLTDGKVLAQFGGLGNKPGKIMQVSQLEVDAGGRLYVGDVGRAKISVFTSTGSFLREFPWQYTGFVVDKYANLHMIHYTDNAGYFYRVYSPKGHLSSSTHLGFLKNINMQIHAVDKDGSLILSMVPTTGLKGKLELLKISKFGDIIEKSEFSRPISMNRYIYLDNNSKVFLAENDLEVAPMSKFTVKPFDWHKNTKTDSPKAKKGAEKNGK